MGSKPASYKSLRGYYNIRAITVDPAELARLVAAENDRTAVIITGSILEDQLREAIRGKFRVMEDDELDDLRIFNPDGPCGSFSTKITMAYALGIIDRETADELEDIREMRNACAHSLRNIDFSTPEFVRVCLRLFKPERGFVVLEPGVEDEPHLLRNAFMLACMAITVAVSHGSREEAAEFLVRSNEEVREELADKMRNASLGTPPQQPSKPDPGNQS